MPAPRKNRRPRRTSSAEGDHAPRAKSWFVTLVILLSLLLHLLVMIAFIYAGRHTPKWSEQAKEEKAPQVTLVLAPPPAQKPDFIPTEPDPNAAHQQSLAPPTCRCRM
jgi:hypothetical protein